MAVPDERTPNWFTPTTTGKNPTATSVRDAKSLASMFGDINYDVDSIRGTFQDATRAQYDGLEADFARTEDKFYNTLYGNQSTALDAIRRSNAEAIATGATRGVQAANELSSIFNLQNQAVDEATQLSQDRNLLAREREGALAEDARNALTYADDNRLALGNLAAIFHQSESAANAQWDAARLAYEGQAADRIDFNQVMTDIMPILEAGGKDMEANLRVLFETYRFPDADKMSKNYARAFGKEQKAQRRQQHKEDYQEMRDDATERFQSQSEEERKTNFWNNVMQAIAAGLTSR